MKCPKCNTLWAYGSEQACCVELFGECMTCRRFRLTQKDIDAVLAKQREISKLQSTSGEQQ